VSEEFRTIDPAVLPPHIGYGFLTTLIVPRPIAFVSTLSSSGVANLAPFSFFMAGGANPLSLMIAPVLNRDLSEKDSLRNIRETGEFVVNIVTRTMAEGMNTTSFAFPADESEWPHSGFTPLPSFNVSPARVLESPAQLECKLFQVVEHGDGALAGRYIIGEVVAIHVREDLMEGDVITPPQPISRLGGPDYLDLASGEIFVLKRPG